MGYYIETPLPIAKALQLKELYGAESYSGTFEDIPEGKVVVAVIQNGPFDAAGICYDADEFEAFSEADDPRPKDLLLLDKDKAIELCPKVAEKL